MRPKRRWVLVLLLVASLLVHTNDAKKGGKKKMKRKAPPPPAPPPETPLPTEAGWAHGDTVTPVQDIFARASALTQRGEYMLAAEGFGQVLRIMPSNAIARINFATTVEKAGHPSLALTHFEQVIDAVDVDAQARATARHRYGVLQVSEAMVMCTAKDRSAERDSPQCASEKQARLEKGAHYLQSLLDDARTDPESEAGAAAARLMIPEHRRNFAQSLIYLGRKAEAAAEYEHLWSGISEDPTAAGWEKALYTFEYAQLLEEQQGQSASGEEAEAIYTEALEMTDGQAHARICALETPLARTVRHCARILELLPEAQHASPSLRQVYTMLGKGHGLLGELSAEAALYDKAVELGVYRDAQQRCQFRVDVDLSLIGTGAGVGGENDLDELTILSLSEMHQQPVPDWRRFEVYRDAVATLEGASDEIREEFLSVVGGVAALDGNGGSGGFSLDVENLTSSGAWRQRTYMKDGEVITNAAGQGADFATTFPKTVAVVERVLRIGAGSGHGGIGASMPESSVEISLLAPGTHIKRHCGPSNHKWRLHLPLVVPTASASAAAAAAAAARLRVSGSTLHWVEGEVLLFDDSFEHEVWNDAETTRAVLIIDLWHPELSDEAVRQAIRGHFGLGTAGGTTATQMQRA